MRDMGEQTRSQQPPDESGSESGAEATSPAREAPAVRTNEGPRPPAAATLRPAAGEKGYSEQQVSEILRRAAQLERGRSVTTAQLSIAEVEQIARESGLDPSLVRLAARSLEESEQGKSAGARLIGAPLRRTIERVVDGELGTQHHENLLADLRSAVPGSMRRPVQISSIGRALSVSGMSGGTRVELTITPRDGKTLLRIQVSAGPLAGGFFGGLMGGLGGFLPPVLAAAQSGGLGAPGTAVLAGGMLGGIFALARGLFSWRAGSSYRRFEQVADQLAERLAVELQK